MPLWVLIRVRPWSPEPKSTSAFRANPEVDSVAVSRTAAPSSGMPSFLSAVTCWSLS